MGLIETLKSMLEPSADETVLYEIRCEECETTEMVNQPPAEANCPNCGATALSEESRLYAGGHAPGGG